MHLSVEANVPTFLRRFEGLVTHLYLDGKRLVTTGLGNLVDNRTGQPPGVIFGLEWVRLPDGARASREEIAAAWHKVHADRTLNPDGGGAAYAALTNIRLSRAGLDQLIASELQRFAAAMRRHFPAFNSWPADAQLGALSMAWAMGADFPLKPEKDGFPLFCAAVRRRDFETAAGQCKMDETGQNDDFRKRNLADRVLFKNAAAVEALGLELDRLFYPRALATEPALSAPAAPTTVPPTGLAQVLRQDATRKGVAEALEAERRGRGGDPDDVA